MMKKSITTPEYERKVPRFKEKFNTHPNQVIPRMDDAGDDIPNQVPVNQIALPNAGLVRKDIPLLISNPLNEGDNMVQVNATVRLSTHVPGVSRGLHMSRIGNIIAEVAGKVYANLQEVASDFAEQLSNIQYQGKSLAEVTATLSYLESVEGWSKEKDKKSLETIELNASTMVGDSTRTESAGIGIKNITACPCVQQTYKHALEVAKKSTREAMGIITPLLTHSQRCDTTVEFQNIHIPLPIRQVLEVLDSILVRTQNTLLRDHELLMVYRAHEKPQFMEDVVRQTLYGLCKAFCATLPESALKVSTKSYESIHDFDIHAEATGAIKDLVNVTSR